MRKTIKLAVVAALLLFTAELLPAMAATSTVPGPAANVVLTIIPPKLPADGGVYQAVVVSLSDSSNLPTVALQNITVFLTSSQTNIAAVPDSVTIVAGQEYVIANVTTTTTPGTALITAHAVGLSSPSSAPLETVTPSGYPSKLLVFASPSTFLPRADSGTVRVEVVDDAGQPSKAIGDIPVTLTSSNATIASLVQTSLTIPQGSIFADGSFTTSGSGSAVITATSGGYSSGAALVTVNKPGACTGSCGPYKLALKVVASGTPGALPSDGGTYKVLEVGIQTVSNTPVTSSSDTVVQLTSDNPDILSLPTLITIPAGSISTMAPVTTSALAGTVNVTATAAGLIPATAQVQTVIPAPSKLQTYVAPPSSAFSSNGDYPILVVQLQDSSGNPARARQDTSVIVTSSNSSLITSFVTLGIPKGSDYVFTYLHTKGVGKSVLTASSQDLVSSESDLVSVPSPLVVKLQLTSTSLQFIYENQTATFTFSAFLEGQPVQNLNVSWAASGGSITPTYGSTGTSGSTSIVFTPGTYGSYNVSAGADSPQTGLVSLAYPLLVAQVPSKPAPSVVQQILGYWYYFVAAAAVVVIAAVYLLRMRRKKQRAEIEAGFEVV
ncbi:MAG TPA: hypothetical protein VLU91_06210 [Nitrososphaerales archaeon]|nr:hypothetical protein [Nitrososphaerales archaeon]